MADDDRLSLAQKERIVTWLRERNVPRACSTCGANKWTLADHLVSPTIHRKGGGLTIGGTAYPQAMLICSNCAHTVYFNAVVMGVIERNPPNEDATPADPKEDSSDG